MPRASVAPRAAPERVERLHRVSTCHEPPPVLVPTVRASTVVRDGALKRSQYKKGSQRCLLLLLPPLSANAKMNGSRMRVYFDYNATTPVAPDAADAVARSTKDLFGNAS